MIKKIAVISEHASPLATIGGVDSGGQNVYVDQLSRHLAALGHRVDVFTRKDNPESSEIMEMADNLRVIHVPAGPSHFVRKEDLLPFMDEFTRYILNFFRNEETPYDIVHANFWMSGMTAMEIKNIFGVPFVVTFHALGKIRKIYQKEADRFPAARSDIEEAIMLQADRIIAECPQDRQDMIDHYRADLRKMTVLPCGYDPQEFWPVERPRARRILGLHPEENIILQLGRMVPRKGVDNVIRGFARLKKILGRACRLLIVGGASPKPDPELTPEIGRLQDIAREEGVGKDVFFVGRVQRSLLKFYYSAADVFVTTPWYEPFGITPLEAMACATPVVGSNVGGIKYSVEDGATGFLVPANDPPALAEKLAGILNDSELENTLGRQARLRAQRFTWEEIAHRLSGLYEEALSVRDVCSSHISR